MLRETTDSGFARAFKRFAQGAVVGLALAGLAACGGGGSSTPAKTTPTPEMTITPGDTFAEAIDITDREVIEGELDSAGDVKFYSLDIAERSTFEFTLEAEAGFEMAILDSDGNVITTAETASVVKRTITAADNLRVRITKTAAAIEANKKFKLVRKYVGIAETLITLIQGKPRFNVTLLGYGFIVDLGEHWSHVGDVPPEVTLGFGVVKMTGVFGNARFYIDPDVGLRHGELVSGRLALCLPKVDYCSSDLVDFVVKIPVTVKRAYRVDADLSRGVVRVTTGGTRSNTGSGSGSDAYTWTSQSLDEYFDYPANTQLTFALEDTPPMERSPLQQWNRIILSRNDRKYLGTVFWPERVGSIPNATMAARLSATDSDGNKASLVFNITIRPGAPTSTTPMTPTPTTPMTPSLTPTPLTSQARSECQTIISAWRNVPAGAPTPSCRAFYCEGLGRDVRLVFSPSVPLCSCCPLYD